MREIYFNDILQIKITDSIESKLKIISYEITFTGLNLLNKSNTSLKRIIIKISRFSKWNKFTY